MRSQEWRWWGSVWTNRLPTSGYSARTINRASLPPSCLPLTLLNNLSSKLHPSICILHIFSIFYTSTPETVHAGYIYLRRTFICDCDSASASAHHPMNLRALRIRLNYIVSPAFLSTSLEAECGVEGVREGWGSGRNERRIHTVEEEEKERERRLPRSANAARTGFFEPRKISMRVQPAESIR